MKALTYLLLFLLVSVSLLAQSVSTLPPSDLLSTDIRDWQLNGLTLLVFVKLAGELVSAIRNGGGLRRIILSVWFGENVPKPIAADYSAELKSRDVPSVKS